MAFVSRAERSLNQVAKSASNLGPGAYTNATTSKAQQSYAPFSTTSERGVSYVTHKSNPGPGAYEVGATFQFTSQYQSGMDQWGQAKPSGAFASHCERFQSKKEIPTPGPGSYNLLQTRSKQTSSKIKQEAVNWLRIPSAPSIPAAGQVFGYDETTSGELVMQKNPEKVYSGDKKDSVGPGHYSVKSFGENKAKGTTWHKSAVKRRTLEASGNPSVGPGSYSEQKLNIAPLYKFKASAAFSSTAKRASFIPAAGKPAAKNEESSSEEEDQGIPGPGHYFNPQSHTSFKSKPLPRNLQYFGSKSIRFRSGSADAVKVGPGYYGDLRKPIATKKPGDSRAPFASTKQRFEKKVNPVPGPGAYKEIIEQSKKTWGKQGVFGTTEKRFIGDKLKDTPGPGYYPPDAYTRLGIHNSANRKPLSVFASKAKREFIPPESNTPAPGSYEITATLGTKKTTLNTQPMLIMLDESNKKSVGFNSQADRFTQQVANPLVIPEKVGPGSYDPREPTKNKSHSTMATVFISRADRFSDNPKENPGPGTYYDDSNDAAWNKRSYNILFSELS